MSCCSSCAEGAPGATGGASGRPFREGLLRTGNTRPAPEKRAPWLALVTAAALVYLVLR